LAVWPIVVYLLLPYVVINLIWRGARYPAYWRRWSERFGYLKPIPGKVIWVHAVSVGEVRSSAALINALGARYPRHQLLVTTMTPTGSDQVRELFADRVKHVYAPYDFPGAVRRFIESAHPEFAVIAETEFWPNIFAACRARGIPLFLVNVRVSQASLRGYLWVPRTARRMFASASLLCAQTRADAIRLRTLGAPEDLVKVTGNLKFDAGVPRALLDEATVLRGLWGRSRPVLIAGSTHPGEEKRLLHAFAELRSAYPGLLLVLVPRHPERFAAVARLCRRSGYRYALRSRHRGSLAEDVAVLVGDTMGELQRLYAASDVAFIGGSLVRKGGQNPLEACAVGVPVVFGPHMFHFEEISIMALDAGAGRQVHDARDLASAVSLYLEQPDLRAAAGRAARALVAANQGALERTLRLITDAYAREHGVEAAQRRGVPTASTLDR
jgi:3-deoxy-D-manno-octulosonic-acid transferase